MARHMVRVVHCIATQRSVPGCSSHCARGHCAAVGRASSPRLRGAEGGGEVEAAGEGRGGGEGEGEGEGPLIT
eukprot:scaffold103135_cov69-Phaeocystis_antarctica.AAC.10